MTCGHACGGLTSLTFIEAGRPHPLCISASPQHSILGWIREERGHLALVRVLSFILLLTVAWAAGSSPAHLDFPAVMDRNLEL